MHPIVTIGAVLGSMLSGPAATPACVLPSSGPEYYAFELFTTRNVPGSGLATGSAELEVSGSSPFSVALGPDGSYVYDIHVSLQRMKTPRQGHLVAWVTTPDLDAVQRLGALDGNLRASGTVAWNKFLVVITWEAEDDPTPPPGRGPSRCGGCPGAG